MKEESEPVILTATLNRLLALLVRNNNITLTRDMLLQQVWEVYGQVASNHNLNNNISMLRKLLAGLGEENIIVTQPKIGFRFAATELQMIGVETVSTNPAVVAQAKPGKTLYVVLCITLAVVTLLTGALFWWSGNNRVLPEAMLGKLSRIGECRVQFVNKYHRVDHEEIERANLQQALNAAGITCDKPAQVYYYNNERLVPSVGQTNSVVFISYCPLATAGEKRMQCENIYANKHA